MVRSHAGPRRVALVVLSSCLLLAGLVPSALAARYHVQDGGTRTGGPSAPGDWSAANCYADLAGAVAAASAVDTVLCDLGEHAVNGPVTLAVAHVGNRELSASPYRATLALAAGGSLVVPGGGHALVLRGLTVAGDGLLRPGPGLLATADGLDLRTEGCLFTGLNSEGSGFTAGGAARITGAGALVMRDTDFVANVGHGRGGAMFLGSGLDAVFERCLWLENAAVQGTGPRGGAIMIDAGEALSTVVFRHCTWRGNVCDGSGGAMSTLSAAVTVEDSHVLENLSGVGNGYSEACGFQFRRDASDHTDPTPAIARRCVFIGNRGVPGPDYTAGDGGAFYTIGADADHMIDALVEDCLFRENVALQGAGVYVSRFSTGAVRRSRFYDNIATFHAGGVFKGGHLYANKGETLEVDSCLFVRNRAGFLADGSPLGWYCRGGAVVSRMFPRVVVRHCTFVDNEVNPSGYHFGDAFAAYWEYGDWEPEMLSVLQNCVFWTSEPGGHVQAWSDGGMALIQNNALQAGEWEFENPMEGTVLLAEAPFTSLETGFPLADGPLIDAGLDLGFTVDIDGRPMPLGAGPDLGCYEWQDVVAVDDTPPVASPARLRAAPNPFNPQTELSYALSADGHVRLRLHDARGALVRELFAGQLPAGEHRWRWDGRDGTGRECATGVYLARVMVDGRATGVAKLTLVR